jgi:hypothetical protein
LLELKFCRLKICKCHKHTYTHSPIAAEKNELGWDEEEEKLHVIIKHLFTLEEAKEGGFEFFEELKQELEEELSKLGVVKVGFCIIIVFVCMWL